jgi:hypothetical protein
VSHGGLERDGGDDDVTFVKEITAVDAPSAAGELSGWRAIDELLMPGDFSVFMYTSWPTQLPFADSDKGVRSDGKADDVLQHMLDVVHVVTDAGARPHPWCDCRNRRAVTDGDDALIVRCNVVEKDPVSHERSLQRVASAARDTRQRVAVLCLEEDMTAETPSAQRDSDGNLKRAKVLEVVGLVRDGFGGGRGAAYSIVFLSQLLT